MKYLGVLIDGTVCFSERIQCLSSKIVRNVELLKKTEIAVSSKSVTAALLSTNPSIFIVLLFDMV